MRAMTIVLEPGHKAKLLEIAAECGAVAPNGWTKGEPSVSELIRQIANGRLGVFITEPKPQTNEMTAERAWSFVAPVWNACHHDLPTFRAEYAKMPAVMAFWPFDCPEVQKLISS